MDSNLIAIRDFQPEDYNFIMSCWLRGLYYGDSWYSTIKKSIFMDNYHAFLTKLMDSKNTSISVAVLKEDPNVILGYSVYSGDVLHWVFVKKAWRGIGIAKSLVISETSTVTHLTKVGQMILNSKKNIEFNPFKIDLTRSQ